MLTAATNGGLLSSVPTLQVVGQGLHGRPIHRAARRQMQATTADKGHGSPRTATRTTPFPIIGSRSPERG